MQIRVLRQRSENNGVPTGQLAIVSSGTRMQALHANGNSKGPFGWTSKRPAVVSG